MGSSWGRRANGVHQRPQSRCRQLSKIEGLLLQSVFVCLLLGWLVACLVLPRICLRARDGGIEPDQHLYILAVACWELITNTFRWLVPLTIRSNYDVTTLKDNLLTGIPAEYSGANPIFAGYVADTDLVHNTIHDSRYSGICVGWGWGEESYVFILSLDPLMTPVVTYSVAHIASFLRTQVRTEHPGGK